MSEMIGVRPPTIDQLVRRAGEKVEMPAGVGKLRIRQAGGMGFLGLNSIYVEGTLGDVTINEKLCIDSYVVTYEQGSLDNGGKLTRVVIGVLEAIAKIERSKLRIPANISPEASREVLAAGYALNWNGTYFVKDFNVSS